LAQLMQMSTPCGTCLRRRSSWRTTRSTSRTLASAGQGRHQQRPTPPLCRCAGAYYMRRAIVGCASYGSKYEGIPRQQLTALILSRLLASRPSKATTWPTRPLTVAHWARSVMYKTSKATYTTIYIGKSTWKFGNHDMQPAREQRKSFQTTRRRHYHENITTRRNDAETQRRRTTHTMTGRQPRGPC